MIQWDLSSCGIVLVCLIIVKLTAGRARNANEQEGGETVGGCVGACMSVQRHAE